jgi:hypothetical protein
LDGTKSVVQDLPSKADMASGYALLGQEAAARKDRDAAKSYLDKAKSLLAQANGDQSTAAEITDAIDQGLAILAGKTEKEMAHADLLAQRKALEAADPTSEQPPEMLAQLALAQREAGDPQGADATMKSALATVEKLGNSRGERTHAQWVVASSVAESGGVPGALHLIEVSGFDPESGQLSGSTSKLDEEPRKTDRPSTRSAWSRFPHLPVTNCTNCIDGPVASFGRIRSKYNI